MGYLGLGGLTWNLEKNQGNPVSGLPKWTGLIFMIQLLFFDTITLSIWVTHLLGYPGFFLSSRLTHLTQGNPLNISMFQTNPPNPPIFSKSQGNPAAGLP